MIKIRESLKKPEVESITDGEIQKHIEQHKNIYMNSENLDGGSSVKEAYPNLPLPFTDDFPEPINEHIARIEIRRNKKWEMECEKMDRGIFDDEDTWEENFSPTKIKDFAERRALEMNNLEKNGILEELLEDGKRCAVEKVMKGIEDAKIEAEAMNTLAKKCGIGLSEVIFYMEVYQVLYREVFCT